MGWVYLGVGLHSTMRQILFLVISFLIFNSTRSGQMIPTMHMNAFEVHCIDHFVIYRILSLCRRVVSSVRVAHAEVNTRSQQIC